MPNLQIQTTRLANAKESMRQAIITKGVGCDTSVKLSDYDDKIRAIPQVISMDDPVTVVFSWMGQDHEPMMERVTVVKGSNVPLPAGFTLGVPAIPDKYPEMTCRILSVATQEYLLNVTYSSVVKAQYNILPSTSMATVFVIDNRNGYLEGTLGISTSTGSPSVDWGDGTAPTTIAPFSHTYATSGIYNIVVSNVSQPRIDGALWSNDQYPEYVAAQVIKFYSAPNFMFIQNDALSKCINLRAILIGQAALDELTNTKDILNLKYYSAPAYRDPTVVLTECGSYYPARAITRVNYGSSDGTTIDGYDWSRIDICGSIPSTASIPDNFLNGQVNLEEMPYSSNTNQVGQSFLANTGIKKTSHFERTGAFTVEGDFLGNCYELLDASNLFDNRTTVSLDYSGNVGKFMNNCRALEHMDILPIFITGASNGNSVTFFTGCQSLKQLPTMHLDTPSSSTHIVNSFNRCYSLESIGDSVNGSFADSQELFFEDTMFDSCYKLKHLYKMAKANFSGTSECFRNCYSLETVDFTSVNASRAPKITVNENGTGDVIGFNNCYSLKKIYVASSQLAAYNALGYGWSKYYNILEGV